MYGAAIVILHRVKRPLHLKDWALARKLSVILHSVWRSGEPFRWEPVASAA